MESYNYCNGCKKSLLISNFDKKNDNENYYTRCKSCRKNHNERYIKKICSKRKLCNNNNCLECFGRSFASFKGKTKNGNLKINYFDVIKNNNLTPRNIIKGTKKKYWFKCDDKNCGHSFNSNIKYITNGSWCSYCSSKKLCNINNCLVCFNKSFASFKEKTKNDNLKIDYWDKIKNNNLTPRNIFKSSGIKYWFKCDDKNCGHSFNSRITHITKNKNWCPFCCIPSKILCDDKECIQCFNKSFASFKEKTKNDNLKIDCWDLIKNNNLTPKNIFKSSNIKYWFKCDDINCGHSFNSRISDISSITKNKGSWCPFCATNNGKLCDDKECISCFNNSFASFKGMINNKLKIDCFNIKKNKITPREIFKSSGKKYIFDCICNHSFTSRLTDITREIKFTWCPHCKGNKTELKLYNWLLKLDFIIKIKKEFSPIWCTTKYIFFKKNKFKNGKYQYRYDFLLVFKNGKKLIIELHGPQHFVQVSNWKGPFLQQIRDKYKERKATQKGIKVITCIQEDVYNNKNNWDTKLLKILKQFN